MRLPSTGRVVPDQRNATARPRTRTARANSTHPRNSRRARVSRSARPLTRLLAVCFGHLLLGLSQSALEGFDMVSLGLTDYLLDRAGYGRFDRSRIRVLVGDDQPRAPDGYGLAGHFLDLAAGSSVQSLASYRPDSGSDRGRREQWRREEADGEPHGSQPGRAL